MSDSEKMATIWPWFNGNGNVGAKDRLQKLENLAHGEGECTPMKKIQEHLTWHEKMSGRRWELYIGFIIVIVSQILSSIFLGG